MHTQVSCIHKGVAKARRLCMGYITPNNNSPLTLRLESAKIIVHQKIKNVRREARFLNAHN